MSRTLDSISLYLDRIVTIPMLLYMYSVQGKYRVNFRYCGWSRYYEGVCFAGAIQMFSSWISADPGNEIVQETLEVVIGNFLAMYRKEISMKYT